MMRMEDPGIRLEKEENSLHVLTETVNKSSQLCEGMCFILRSFDDHLMKLERTILPVYQETGDLQCQQENIASILENLDHIIAFYSVSREVESTIQDGPTGSLPKFLEAIEKLKSAMDFFHQSDPNSAELAELTSLYDVGNDKLKTEFRTLLVYNSKPVPALTLLDLIAVDEEWQLYFEKVQVQQLSDNVLKDLKKITDWLCSVKSYDYLHVYASIRSNCLTKTLQNLKDHQKVSASSSTSLVQNSPQLGSRKSLAKDNTPRRPPKTIQQFMKRKATAVIAKYSSAAVETAVLGHRLPTALLPPDPKDEIPDYEVMSYMTSISGLLNMVQSEFKLMVGLIPEEVQMLAIELIVTESFDNLKNDTESIVNRVKRCVSRHDFSTALNLFPILRHLMSVKPYFETTLQSCSQLNKLQEITITLHTTLNKALEEFIESIRKTDPDTKLPKDGTVHELTSNAMMLLEQLLDYQDILRNVLILQDASFTSGDTGGKLAFSQYITRVLTAMGSKLQNKSEAYSDPYLKAIFRINNLHYILKSLQRTGLINIVHFHYPNAENHYNDQMRDQKRIYSQSWSRVLHYVMEVDRPISQQRTASTMAQLKDKDKQNIKDKFTGFNKEMDEIYKIQKAYAIPDVELRESLKRENKNYILPKYQMFYEKYVNIPFTKNPDKYLRYTPLVVAETMDSFFDAAA